MGDQDNFTVPQPKYSIPSIFQDDRLDVEYQEL